MEKLSSDTGYFKKPVEINRGYDYFSEFASEALHIVIFEIFIKSMTSCLSKLKVTTSFCFAFKIHDDVTATNNYKRYFQLLLAFHPT